MNVYLAQLAGAARAVRILSPTTFSWFGKPSPPLPRDIRRAITPPTARDYLLYNLQARLYGDFYCLGAAAPSNPDPGHYSLSGLTPFVEQLSASNTGSGYWSGGWEVLSVESAYLGLHKQGVRIWAEPGAVAREGGQAGPMSPGMGARARFPKESPGLSPGYYMALGDTCLSPRDTRGIVRLYWNIAVEGASLLMRLVTAALNSRQIPFRFKVLGDPGRFDRCDAAVLYVLKPDYPVVSTLLTSVYSEVASYLIPGTPSLTKALAPGLGLAEDPDQGESFGLHRCRLIAEGLVRAHETGANRPREKILAITGCLEEHGISVTTPYLNPRSVGDYGFATSNTYLSAGTPEGSEDRRRTHALPDDYLQTALNIACRIVREAVWYEGRCAWLGAEPRPNPRTGQYDLGYAALGPTLYTGTAGVALFLSELYAVHPDDNLGVTAQGAVRHALSQVEQVPSEVRPSLYSGWTGIALATARAGLLLGVDEFVDRAAQLIVSLQHGPPIEEFDLLAGKAGAIAGCMVLADYLQEPSLVDYASRLAGEIISAADTRGPGLSWRSSLHRAGRNLTGFSHGVAGVGYALLELWNVTQEMDYRRVALSAFEYERHWFDPEAGNWPDFRLETGDQRRWRSGSRKGPREEWPFARAWCNGAPGITLSRLRAYELLGDTACKLEALSGLRTTEQQVKSGLEAASPGFSLCHGLAGNAQLLLYGASLPGLGWIPQEPNLLQRVAWEGMDRYGSGERPWPCGTPGGTTPNLMLGTAGIGHFYLRLYNPPTPSILLLTREEWLPTAASLRDAHNAEGTAQQ